MFSGHEYQTARSFVSSIGNIGNYHPSINILSLNDRDLVDDARPQTTMRTLKLNSLCLAFRCSTKDHVQAGI